MDIDELAHKEDLLKEYKRVLRIFETQASHFGIHVPPHIVIEIEDIKDKIGQIERYITYWKNEMRKSVIFEDYREGDDIIVRKEIDKEEHYVIDFDTLDFYIHNITEDILTKLLITVNSCMPTPGVGIYLSSGGTTNSIYRRGKGREIANYIIESKRLMEKKGEAALIIHLMFSASALNQGNITLYIHANRSQIVIESPQRDLILNIYKDIVAFLRELKTMPLQ